jgi:hypothetical protein
MSSGIPDAHAAAQSPLPRRPLGQTGSAVGHGIQVMLLKEPSPRDSSQDKDHSSRILLAEHYFYNTTITSNHFFMGESRCQVVSHHSDF